MVTLLCCQSQSLLLDDLHGLDGQFRKVLRGILDLDLDLVLVSVEVLVEQSRLGIIVLLSVVDGRHAEEFRHDLVEDDDDLVELTLVVVLLFGKNRLSRC